MQQYLCMCCGMYTDTFSSLRAAAALLKTTKNKDGIMADLSAVARSSRSCENNFQEVRRMKFHLGWVNSSLMKMVKNSMAVGSRLQINCSGT